MVIPSVIQRAISQLKHVLAQSGGRDDFPPLSPAALRRGFFRLRATSLRAAALKTERPRREVVRAGASLPEITLGGSNRAAMIILPRKWQNCVYSLGSPLGSPLSRKMNDRFFNSTAVMGNHRSARRLCYS